ncbi:MAG: hypothetical protein FIA99_14555 [Ruminiclostridium sp.]|nr:hypothetical protein [Ruminiclostridium sp.]
MVTGDTKKIVVIRDISSNLIEEAILILKCDPGSQNDIGQPVTLKKNGRIRNEFILKEAESLINNYIRENRLHIIPDRHGKKMKFIQRKSLIGFIINLLLAGSIGLLIFMAGRLF